MKTLIYSLFVVLTTTTSFSQSEEIHDAKIIGSFELETKEVTTIYDEITGCERKTSPHSKNLLTPNESVQIKISDNQQMAEVIKPNLPEQVYANKNCGNEQVCNSAICVLVNNTNNLQLKYTSNGYKVFYNASKTGNNSIKSSLIIFGGNNGNGSLPIVHFLDKTEPNSYKLTSYKSVIEESNKLSKRPGIQITNAEGNLLENLLSDIKSLEPTLTQSEMAKSIFYHLAIIKTTKRALENNSSECNCTPVPLYFNDKTPFICQEDLSYDIDELLTNLEESLTELSQNYDAQTIQTVKTYLETKSTQSNTISFGDSYVDLSNGVPTNQFNAAIEDHIETLGCLLGPGSGLGCCGNYSGCCWYWSITCLNHDIACFHCDHWWCGWQCTPI